MTQADGSGRAAPLGGRTAVVTGAGRGIGAAIARLLAAQGAAVLLTARSQRQLDALARELNDAGHRAVAHACDVADADAIHTLRTHAEAELGAVDILVNNAGIAESAKLEDQTLESWNRILAVNLTAPFLCSQAFVPGMKRRGWGRIVNVASVTSRVGTPYVTAYTASKHGVLGFSRSLAAELRSRGVTVNCVCPGYVDTDMTQDSVGRVAARTGRSESDSLSAILATVGQPRLIRPEEVAFLVAALCHDQAGGTTGQAIVMDGGGFLG